ncbi:DNA methylase family protein [Escherichia coli P0302293.6]|nr:DNA methylase family protein [Escherichia coli P0302293.6]
MRLHPGKRPPRLPQNPLPDVLGWKYSAIASPDGKAVTSLQPLIESFTHPNAIVLDPFAGSGSTCVPPSSPDAGISVSSCLSSITVPAATLRRQRAMQQGAAMMTGLCRRLRK